MAERPTTVPASTDTRRSWVRPDFDQFETAPEVTDYAARLP
jgi:hypothetical protein